MLIELAERSVERNHPPDLRPSERIVGPILRNHGREIAPQDGADHFTNGAEEGEEAGHFGHPILILYVRSLHRQMRAPAECNRSPHASSAAL